MGEGGDGGGGGGGGDSVPPVFLLHSVTISSAECFYLFLDDEQLYTFLVICGFVAGALYTVMDTLLNPVLSDHFGFTIADSSYFVFGVTCVLVGGVGIL